MTGIVFSFENVLHKASMQRYPDVNCLPLTFRFGQHLQPLAFRNGSLGDRQQAHRSLPAIQCAIRLPDSEGKSQALCQNKRDPATGSGTRGRFPVKCHAVMRMKLFTQEILSALGLLLPSSPFKGKKKGPLQ